MKEFSKTEADLFICEECNSLFASKRGLAMHIKNQHNSKLYYDKWIMDFNEDKCKICKNQTEFISIQKGYKKCCSKICSNKYTHLKTEESFIKKYSKHPKQTDEIKNKCIENHLKEYGVKNPYQRKEIKDKIKQTKFKKHGDENYTNRKKAKETCIKLYGVENPFQNKEIFSKCQKTSLLKYGVEYANQNINIYNKGLKTRFLIHKFKDTNLWYQGTYELDFLNKYYDKFSDIQRGPSIRYIYNGKNKVYHPDFYISSLNLIVEIKSTWILNKDIEIEEKKKATISNGFKYLMILDKNYQNFLSLAQTNSNCGCY
jgi:hypothetical protein